MKALVTGGAGFIGANLVRELIGQGIEVRVLVRQGGRARNLAGLDLEIARGDVRSLEDVCEAMKGCDQVFHVAAFYSTEAIHGPLLYAINVGGTKNVLTAAGKLGVSKVVHTSTIGTIGRPRESTLADETCQFNVWDIATHYAKSKYLGEMAALEAAAAGLPLVVVNPCAPVGPYDVKPSATGQRILDFLSGRMPSFVGGGINFVDVADVARGHVLAAMKGRVGERYILGNTNLTLTEFLAVLKRVSGQQGPRWGRRATVKAVLGRVLPRHTREPGPLPALTCDCSKAISELGLPQSPLETAFERSVAWFRDNGYVGDAKSRVGA